MNRLIDCQLPHLGSKNVGIVVVSSNRIESMKKNSMTIFGIVLTLVIAIKDRFMHFRCVYLVFVYARTGYAFDEIVIFALEARYSQSIDSHNYRLIHVVIPNRLLCIICEHCAFHSPVPPRVVQIFRFISR